MRSHLGLEEKLGMPGLWEGKIRQGKKRLCGSVWEDEREVAVLLGWRGKAYRRKVTRMGKVKSKED